MKKSKLFALLLAFMASAVISSPQAAYAAKNGNGGGGVPTGNPHSNVVPKACDKPKVAANNQNCVQSVPEFGTSAAAIAGISGLGVYAVIRRRQSAEQR